MVLCVDEINQIQALDWAQLGPLAARTVFVVDGADLSGATSALLAGVSRAKVDWPGPSSAAGPLASSLLRHAFQQLGTEYAFTEVQNHDC
jgi:hypothetical protein